MRGIFHDGGQCISRSVCHLCFSSSLYSFGTGPMSGACQPQWSSDQQESQWNDANEPWSVCGGLAGDLLVCLAALVGILCFASTNQKAPPHTTTKNCTITKLDCRILYN